MAFNKRTWKARQGTGLNKFSIGGASPVTIVNQPDSVTQVGDALSAGNLNDLENRIADAFDETASQTEVTNLNNAITAIDHRVQNLEQAKGSYVVQNYKDGSITPSGKGNWAIVEGLRGVSRVENQLFKTSASRTIGGVTCTNVDGTLTLSGVSTLSYAEIFDNMQIVANHSYLVYFADVVNPNNLSFNVGSLNTTVKSYLGTPKVATPTNGLVSSGMGIESYSSGTDFTGISFKFFIRDLNVHFGTNDLSFLGATDSAKLATIQQNYPHLLTPSEYGVRIVDSSYSGVRAWARNLWNEEWEVGAWNLTTGEKANSSTNIRCKNKIAVKPLTTYFFMASKIYYALFYDANDNFIGKLGANGWQNGNTSFETPANCAYVAFYMYDTYGTTYGHDICINKSDSQNGTYTPYHAPSTLSLSFQGKSAGSVYDSCEPNVEVGGVARKRTTQRVGTIVYDGSSDENWVDASGGNFYIQKNDLVKASNYTVKMICGKLKVVTRHGALTNMSVTGYLDGGNIYPNQNWIYVRIDDTITTVEQLRTWLAQNPVTINYELATPVVTLSDPIPDNTLLTEAGGRMATVQTGTVVDGSFDMGFITL